MTHLGVSTHSLKSIKLCHEPFVDARTRTAPQPFQASKSANGFELMAFALQRLLFEDRFCCKRFGLYGRLLINQLTNLLLKY